MYDSILKHIILSKNRNRYDFLEQYLPDLSFSQILLTVSDPASGVVIEIRNMHLTVFVCLGFQGFVCLRFLFILWWFVCFYFFSFFS